MGKPYVIGIAGGTCSGKSTLADYLYENLKNHSAVLINMDNYFKKEIPTVISPFTKKEYPEHNHPDTLDLEKLNADFQKAITDNSNSIVIIEGLFALYLEEIRSFLDLKIFVDLKSDERLARRIKRFSDIGQSFEEITERYLDTVRYRHDEFVEPSRWFADLIVNGNIYSNNGKEIVLKHILNTIK